MDEATINGIVAIVAFITTLIFLYYLMRDPLDGLRKPRKDPA